jgi:hypothetical protein
MAGLRASVADSDPIQRRKLTQAAPCVSGWRGNREIGPKHQGQLETSVGARGADGLSDTRGPHRSGSNELARVVKWDLGRGEGRFNPRGGFLFFFFFLSLSFLVSPFYSKFKISSSVYLLFKNSNSFNCMSYNYVYLFIYLFIYLLISLN